MAKGDLIGKGMTAEVYEWGHDKVLKLYFDKFGDEWIKHEADIGYKLHEAGLPSPQVFDMVDIEGRKGLIFQRIFGKSILRHIEVEPWNLYYYAQQMAKVHFKIHKCTADGLPSQRERFSYTLKRSSEILGDKIPKILDYIESLPKGNNVCHGDLHFNNIIVSGNKFVAIDWNGAYTGNFLGDVARTCMIINSPAIPYGTLDIMNNTFQYVKRSIYWTYISEYMRLAKIKLEDIDEWMLPVAAAKLKDRVPGEEKWLMNIINKRLEKLAL